MSADAHFSERLKTAMDAGGYNKHSLSKVLGVAHTTVGGWLKGADLAAEKVPKIARALSVDAQWLLTGDTSKVAEAAANAQKKLEVAEQDGGLDLEKQVLDEIRVRVEQFKVAHRDVRARYRHQIISRLDEYDAWCEEHYASTRAALKEHGRVRYSQPKGPEE